MGKFITGLEVEQIEDVGAEGRGTWRLLAPLTYISTAGETYTVPPGFITDFASVPRIPLIFDYLGDRGNLAGTLHDYLYTKPAVTDKGKADRLLQEALIAQGVNPVMAFCFYIGVKLGGAKYYNQ